MPLPQHFHIPPAGSPDPSFTCEGEYWRIQVLSDALIRVEWSPSGQWEDRPTQIVVNRRGEAPCECRIERDVCGEGSIRITTAAMSLTYDGNEFSPHGLYAQVRNEAQWGGVWRWDVNEEHPWLYGHNMGGTTRTLDTVDGACDVDPGIIDGRGIVALNDPSAALTPEGWVAPREEGSRDVYIFAHGHRFDEALRDFYRLTGAQPVIPRYALGNWWSRYHAYTAAEYRQVMDDFDAHDIPLAVAVIDMDWHLTDIPARYGSGWTGCTWNRELFPDPEAFLAHLHDRGLRVTLNLHPADGIRGHEEAYAALARRLGHNTSDDAPIPFDVANPDFMTAYFEEVLAPLEQQGVDFWWVDWQQGEYASIPGIDPLWILNHMHVLDHAHRNGGRGLTLSRYAGPGSHRYPVGFSGDTIISWESLAFQPEFTAMASNIGYGWWSHDIGGHMFGIRDHELSTRWVQYGVMSPIMRLHSSNNPFTRKEPWSFPEPHCRIQEEALRLRHRLVPYLHTEQVTGHEDLRPLIRPMYYEDPVHEGAWTHPSSYMLGRSLLTAPITSPCDPTSQRAHVRVWLPEGQWTDIFTGLTYRGGRSIRAHRTLSDIPVFARSGTVLPLAGISSADEAELGRAHHPRVGIDLPSACEILVVAGADGEYELIEDDDREGGEQVRTRITWTDATRTLTVHAPQGATHLLPPMRTWALRLVGGISQECEEYGSREGKSSPAVWEKETGALLCAGDPAPAQAEVILCPHPAAPMPKEACLYGRARRVLEDAQMSIEVKGTVDEGLARGGVHALSACMDDGIPDSVRMALLEILTADDSADRTHKGETHVIC